MNIINNIYLIRFCLKIKIFNNQSKPSIYLNLRKTFRLFFFLRSFIDIKFQGYGRSLSRNQIRIWLKIALIIDQKCTKKPENKGKKSYF